MIFEYYPDSDMLYIRLTEAPSVESEEAAPDIVLELDGESQVVGIEIEDAGKRKDLSRLELRALPITNLLISEPISAVTGD